MTNIFSMTQDEIYDIVAHERVDAATPRLEEDRIFTASATAYKWTNESLCELESDLHLNLSKRDALLIACSGDPIVVFAYLNAGNQVAFDTSHKAVLWSELKIEAIRQFSWPQFCAFFGLTCDKEAKPKPTYEELRHRLSAYATSVFDRLIGKNTAAQIMGNHDFFRRPGYTGAFPTLNIFSTGEEKYNKAKKQLLETKIAFVAGGLDAALKLTANQTFGAFYGSNALDHFRNSAGDFDYSRKNFDPFLKAIEGKMDEKALQVYNFEWSDGENAKTILREMGYKLSHASRRAGGYGRLYLAKR